MPSSLSAPASSISFTTPAELELSPVIAKYLGLLAQVKSDQAESQTTVEVSDVVGVWAFAYEKLRNSLEYREEGVLLRGAIKRILKRRLNLLWQYDSTASALVRELIWARYLSNDSVPQSKVDQIEQLLAKYSLLRQSVIGRQNSEEWQDWIIGIAACDIEQVLLDKTDSYALAEVLLQWLRQSLLIDGLTDPAERDIQLYLAIHRTLLKSDATLMTYHLFLINQPEWAGATEETTIDIARRLSEIRIAIGQQLNHPQSRLITRSVRKWIPAFLILNDLTTDNPVGARHILAQPEVLRQKVEELCANRYASIQNRIRTAIVRSIFYILLTKVGLALVMEVPGRG